MTRAVGDLSSLAIEPGVSRTPIRLGMPQLNHVGLSESWLFRHAGHLHWTAVAGVLGTETHDIRDARGERLYAAFLSARVDGRRFGDVGENDVLDGLHRLTAFAPPYAASEWILHDPAHPTADPVARIELLSAFIRRTAGTDNRHVAKSLPQSDPRSVYGRPLIQRQRQAHRAVRPMALAPEVRLAYPICPSVDLNGAGFLYFAALLDIVKRGEARIPGTLARSFERYIAYYGNENDDATLDVASGRGPAPALAFARPGRTVTTSVTPAGGARLLARSILSVR